MSWWVWPNNSTFRIIKSIQKAVWSQSFMFFFLPLIFWRYCEVVAEEQSAAQTAPSRFWKLHLCSRIKKKTHPSGDLSTEKWSQSGSGWSDLKLLKKDDQAEKLEAKEAGLFLNRHLKSQTLCFSVMFFFWFWGCWLFYFMLCWKDEWFFPADIALLAENIYFIKRNDIKIHKCLPYKFAC